jgi:hypothetical protein
VQTLRLQWPIALAMGLLKMRRTCLVAEGGPQRASRYHNGNGKTRQDGCRQYHVRKVDVFSGLCPVGSPPCQKEDEEKERRDDAENCCAARAALASRRALKHQDTRRDFNHFLPGARSSLHSVNAPHWQGEKFLDGTAARSQWGARLGK